MSQLAESMGGPNGSTRKEDRLLANEPVEIAYLNGNLSSEITTTQNVSFHGARVTTHRVWEPGRFLLVRSLRTTFWARARIVYWRSFSSSRFSVGLEFITQEGEWVPSN